LKISLKKVLFGIFKQCAPYIGKKKNPRTTPQIERVPARTNSLFSGESKKNMEPKTIAKTRRLFTTVKIVGTLILFVTVKMFQRDSKGKVYGRANVPKIVNRISLDESSVGSQSLKKQSP
jgi:hypothetical protein